MAEVPAGHSDDFRRKWDKEFFEKLARERLKREKEEKDVVKKGSKREKLKAREYKIDLDSQVGKSVVVAKNAPLDQSGGYYCNVCECVVKDSINFLDHINGKKHQRNIGMSMRVEQSTLEQVKRRFEIVKKKKDEEKKKYDFEERMKELREEEEKVKEYRKEKRKERKRKPRDDDDLDEGMDPEMAAMMGFSGFGGSKKSH
ncbi:zinc finger matrin-type protein 2-like [Dysidea avara]|uniref:zinc finger matrin-type protein 2-like n=1 Tax=Dysidea avara TaxID=196820 RepID=UPI0033270391